MILKDLTQEITERLARDCSDQNRVQTIRAYERNYRELEGDVFSSDDDLKYYWPQRYKETNAAYRERVKIWTHIPKIIIQRIVSLLLQGETRREWEPISDEYRPVSDRANELETMCNEVNDWEAKSAWCYYYALGIGEVAIWPEFRRYDKLTGEPYDPAGGLGIPIWSYWFPWFVEPISLQDYAEEVIGAAKLIYLDGNVATPLVTQSVTGGKQKAITQLWLGKQYDRMTGKATHEGFYRSWTNAKEDVQYDEQGNPDASWWGKNHYGVNPVVFFGGPDPDETQYRGRSYVDRFRRLAINHTQTVSNIGQAIDVLPNIWKYTGEQKQIDKLTIRTNQVVQIPTGGTFEQASRELNLSEDWKLVNYIEKMISLLGAIPAEVWDMLGSAGKVESGVALRLVMQPMAESISITRKHMARNEKQKMRNTVRMFNFHNQDVPIDMTVIRPTVIHEQNVIPVDDAIDVLNDIQLLDKGVKSLEELVRKYHPELTRPDQVKAFIDERSREASARAPKTLFTRTNANTVTNTL